PIDERPAQRVIGLEYPASPTDSVAVNPRAASPHEASSPPESAPVTDAGERVAFPEAVASSFLAHSDDLFSISGTDGRMKWANPAHERILGWSPQELIGRAYLELVHPEDRDRVLAEAAVLSGSGRSTVDLETRLRCKDGSH